MHWYRVAKKARWSSLVEVRADFPHADLVQGLIVFNIGGNKYRLVAAINYRVQAVFIRSILTHAAYDKGRWKT